VKEQGKLYTLNHWIAGFISPLRTSMILKTEEAEILAEMQQ
jgi:hypothetical protein